MQEIAQTLQELGLTKNEITIYLFLLKFGETTTGSIIKETRISNSRVYESLNSLISHGLVGYNVQKDGKHFSAQDPKALIELEEQRKQKIESLVPQLSTLISDKDIETKTAVYEGFDGFKTAFRKIIEDCPRGSEILITGFPEGIYNEESLRLFLTNMNLKSAAKKQKLKVLLEKSAKKTLGADREAEKFTEVKYMPKGFMSPAGMDIFEDYVYIFLWDEKPFVFMIKNKKIAKSFKSYHEFLWKMAKV
jgi:sugar-specific transcriptional regulator TrmB